MSKANNYDKFVALRQAELIKGEKLPHRFVEKPMMRDLLPSLHNKSVILLGCGSGEESIMIKQAGANRIVGIDISKESIKLARKTYPDCEFKIGDINKLEFEDNSFEFAYSSLSLHYSSQPKKVYNEIFRVLKPGGELLFSVAHPIRWASEKVIIDGMPLKLIGFSNDEKTPKLYGKYLTFAEHEHHFPSGETLKFWVGAPSFHFNLLRKSGFVIQDFVESKAIDSCKRENPYYFERYREFPQFMAFFVKKPSR